MAAERIFNATDTTDASDFGGKKKCVIRVYRSDGAAWPSGNVVDLQWKDPDGNWRNENIQWTADGPQTVFMVKGDDYRLYTTTAGYIGFLSSDVDEEE